MTRIIISIITILGFIKTVGEPPQDHKLDQSGKENSLPQKLEKTKEVLENLPDFEHENYIPSATDALIHLSTYFDMDLTTLAAIILVPLLFKCTPTINDKMTAFEQEEFKERINKKLDYVPPRKLADERFYTGPGYAGMKLAKTMIAAAKKKMPRAVPKKRSPFLSSLPSVNDNNDNNNNKPLFKMDKKPQCIDSREFGSWKINQQLDSINRIKKSAPRIIDITLADEILINGRIQQINGSTTIEVSFDTETNRYHNPLIEGYLQGVDFSTDQLKSQIKLIEQGTTAEKSKISRQMVSVLTFNHLVEAYACRKGIVIESYDIESLSKQFTPGYIQLILKFANNNVDKLIQYSWDNHLDDRFTPFIKGVTTDYSSQYLENFHRVKVNKPSFKTIVDFAEAADVDGMEYLKPLAAIIDQFKAEECPLIMIKGQNAEQMLERLDYLLSHDYKHLETQEIIMNLVSHPMVTPDQISSFRSYLQDKNDQWIQQIPKDMPVADQNKKFRFYCEIDNFLIDNYVYTKYKQ